CQVSDGHVNSGSDQESCTNSDASLAESVADAIRFKEASYAFIGIPCCRSYEAGQAIYEFPHQPSAAGNFFVRSRDRPKCLQRHPRSAARPGTEPVRIAATANRYPRAQKTVVANRDTMRHGAPTTYDDTIANFAEGL